MTKKQVSIYRHIICYSAPTQPPSTQFKHVGCWKVTTRHAIPTLEGKDVRLQGNYRTREYAIDLCYKAAKARGYHIFALQNGGWCAGMKGSTRYQKYGKSSNCKNGRGGYWANDVYQIGGKQQSLDRFYTIYLAGLFSPASLNANLVLSSGVHRERASPKKTIPSNCYFG